MESVSVSALPFIVLGFIPVQNCQAYKTNYQLPGL